MSAVFDIKVLELLSARMCHDLISPVSAIGNGVELITEFDDAMQGEALSLIGESAASASRLLQFYRAALGSARAADGGPLGLGEARKRALEALGGGHIGIDWPETSSDAVPCILGRPVKLLLGLVLLATDFLPGRGEIGVRVTPDGKAVRAEVSAMKEGFVLSSEFHAALDGTAPSDDLTPRTVTGRYCLLVAQSLGTSLDLDAQPGQVVLRALLPAGA